MALFDILTRGGPETVERFAIEWHGQPQRPVETFGESADLPAALQLVYSASHKGATFYASDELLAVSAFNGPEEHRAELLSVWVGARDPDALQALDPLIDRSWEYDSRRS